MKNENSMTKKTTEAALKPRPSLQEVLTAARSFISGFKNDDAQEEPVDDLLDDLSHYIDTRPAIYIYVSGYKVQGASATIPITVNIFDHDDYNGCDNDKEEKEFIELYGTPEEWEEMIQRRTAAGEIIPVY